MTRAAGDDAARVVQEELLPVAEQRIVRLLAELAGRQAVEQQEAGHHVLIGLAGRSIQSSRSPIMHEREGARLGMRYTYALIDFDRFDLPDEAIGDVLAAAETLGFAGLNITHPLKQSVIRHLTTLAPDAAAIGAVNTVVLRAKERSGHNTDCWGFAESFRDGMAGCSLEAVVQFGAGGAGAAVGYALMELGVSDLAVVDSDPARAVRLAERLSARFGARVRACGSPEDCLGGAQGVVNTTPVGMAKYPGAPFSVEKLSSRHWVADIVYFPRETELLRHARAIGCRVLPGAGMAVYQAVRAFELFTGIAPDRSAMISHFEAAA